MGCRIGSLQRLRSVDYGVCGFDEIAHRAARIARSHGEILAWLLLGRSIVAMEMVAVEMVVDQSDRSPSAVEQKLKHDGVLVNRPATHAHQDARICAA
jgi:hypothetical protein